MDFNKKKLNELIPISLLIVMFFLSFYYYGKIPERIPTHWNAEGQIDAYGGRITLFIIPVISFLLYLFFLIIPKIEVFRKNVEEFYAKHGVGFKTILLLFFFGIFFVTLSTSLGKPVEMNLFIFPGISILFFYIGMILPNLKRNFFIGIKTPWTLANDNVWEKTHKVGGKVFQVMAILFLSGVFVHENIFWIIVLPMLLMVVFLYAYSFWLFKKENGKNELN